jgi:hypothetical protein
MDKARNPVIPSDSLLRDLIACHIPLSTTDWDDLSWEFQSV